MANIYKEQAKAVRTPSPLDTGVMKHFDKKRREGLDIVGKTADFLMDQQEKEDNAITAQVETAAMQVYKNGYTLHGDQPEEYTKFVAEGLEKIYTNIPDSKSKHRAMAKVSIAGSGYNAKVQKNHSDNMQKIRVEKIKDNTFSSIESAKAGLSGLFSAQDVNLSPEQRLVQAQAFDDAQIPLYNAYQQRYAQDTNGNFVYNAAERATIEDAWENRGSHAVLDYVGDNITNNRAGTIELVDDLINNKQEIMEQYNISEEAFAKTINNAQKIIKGQTTRQDLEKAESVQLVNNAVVKDMEIGADGKVGNPEYDNIDKLVATYKQLQESEKFTAKEGRKKLAQNKGKVSRAIIKHIEDGADLTFDRNFIQKSVFKTKPNVGEVAVMQINENIDKFKRTMAYQKLDKDLQDEIKADMYVEVLGGLQAAEGIELKDNDDPAEIQAAKKIAVGSYYRQIEGVVGYKPFVKDPDSPESVRMAYENALMQHDNNMALNNIRQRLGLK